MRLSICKNSTYTQGKKDIENRADSKLLCDGVINANFYTALKNITNLNINIDNKNDGREISRLSIGCGGGGDLYCSHTLSNFQLSTNNSIILFKKEYFLNFSDQDTNLNIGQLKLEQGVYSLSTFATNGKDSRLFLVQFNAYEYNITNPYCCEKVKAVVNTTKSG